MFEIGWTEILVIAVVAIVVFPSKDLPKLLRTVGQMLGKARRMAGDFQSQFNSALREAEREADFMDTKAELEGLKKLNPLADLKKTLDPIRNPVESIRRELMTPTASAGAAMAAAKPVGAVADPNAPAAPVAAPVAPVATVVPAATAPQATDLVAPNVAAPAVVPPPVSITVPSSSDAPATMPSKTADGGTP